MDLLTLDAETYYDDSYSLSKMTTEAYIRDSRFEEILWSVKWNDAPAFWVLPERFAYFVKDEVDWANTALVHHHAHFDGAILSWRHGVRPAMFIDTLSMARAIDGPKAGNSLHDLCIRHGIGAKGDYVTFAKGKHSSDFSVNELYEYGVYSCNDSDRTFNLAQIFLPQLPADELKVIDLIIRMFTEPLLVGNESMLATAVATERQRKIDLLRRINLLCPTCGGAGEFGLVGLPPSKCPKCDGLGVDKKPIGSNEQFANLLRQFGVEPQTKPSPTNGQPIYAFARTDPAMQALLEDEEEEVRFLAEARIGVKSNIIETRAERFRDCASRGAMPVYIKYAAAHTLRIGGGDSMNWLNMSGKNVKRPEMEVLKASVGAPPGYKVIRVDSGQGEARILAWLAGQNDLVEAFRQGRDVYSEHASTVYMRPVDRKRNPEDHIPGQLGKVSILGMGFGMYWFKASQELLKGMLGAPPIQFKMDDLERLQVDPSRFLNSPKNIERVNAMPSRLELNDRLIHCAVTKALCDRYRARMSRISGVGLSAPDKGYWDLMEDVITAMIEGREMVFGAHGIMRTGHECIHLPNGMNLHYRGIARDEHGEASYFDGRQRTHVYGALITENTVQCIHRLVVTEQMMEIAALLPVKLHTYDDVVAIVPDDAVPEALQFMVQAMARTPAGYEGLPLIGEGKAGQTLLDAK